MKNKKPRRSPPSKHPIIYSMVSKTCTKACTACRLGLTCSFQVFRMTTAPDCPTHATTIYPPRKSSGRVVYLHDDETLFSYSCLSAALTAGAKAGRLVRVSGEKIGSETAAIAWLLGAEHSGLDYLE